jgi:chromosome segregation ATPase
MSNKAKHDSPLVKAVLALDNHLSELERVGTKINATDMTSDVDVDFIQKLMARFAECGQGIAEEVANLSRHLQEAQTHSQSIADGVGRQAELFTARRTEQNQKVEQFQLLGEKVRELNTEITRFRDDRTQLIANIPHLETQLTALIDELETLRQSARGSRMRSLEKNAESLTQTLQAVRRRLRDVSSNP